MRFLLNPVKGEEQKRIEINKNPTSFHLFTTVATETETIVCG